MTTPTPRRRARTRAIAASLATALALLLATASPAGAAVTVSGGPTWVDLETVTVSGTTASRPTATHVVILQCDVTPPVVPGTRCSSMSATWYVPVTGGAFSVPGFVLDQQWSVSWNFTVDPPAASATPVDCATVGDRDCAVVVAFHHFTSYPNGQTYLGRETFPLAYVWPSSIRCGTRCAWPRPRAPPVLVVTLRGDHDPDC